MSSPKTYLIKINQQKKKSPIVFERKKHNATILNYINQKLQIAEFKQYLKNHQLSNNSSNQSLHSKSSKSLPKSHKANSAFSHSKHKNTVTHLVNTSHITPHPLSRKEHSLEHRQSLSPQIGETNEMKALKKENRKLKDEIAQCHRKIKSLEKVIETFLSENYPIDITKCPKPTPYISNHYNYNYYSYNGFDSYNTINNVSINQTIY